MANRNTAFKVALSEAKAETARYIQTLIDEPKKKSAVSQAHQTGEKAGGNEAQNQSQERKRK